MVGRLVQEQQLGPAKQQFGKGDSHLPPPRKGFGCAIKLLGSEAETAKYRCYLAVDVVPTAVPETLLSLAVAA